jgi:hypothetical protein
MKELPIEAGATTSWEERMADFIAASAKLRYAARTPKDEYAGELIWEIDTAKVGGNGGLSYLTIAVDRTTGVIVGRHLHQRPPCGQTFIACLLNGAKRHGLPKAIVVDRGRSYCVQDVHDRLDSLRVELRYRTRYPTRGTALVERAIRRLTSAREKDRARGDYC